MLLTSRRFLAILFWFVLIQLATGYVEACTCMMDPDPPCRAVGSADAIFEAEVLRREKIEADNDSPETRRFTMKVKNVYKGSLGEAVYVYTGIGDSDCGYRFSVGSRYLVYADEYDGHLTAGICTRTRKLEDAKDDVAYFRQLPTMPSGARVFGKVMQKVERRGESQSEGVRGIKIEIDGAEKRTVLTNAEGSFSVGGLTPGGYRVKAILPDGFKLSPMSFVELYPYPIYEENIPDKGCVETYFVIEPDK